MGDTNVQLLYSPAGGLIALDERKLDQVEKLFVQGSTPWLSL
jgi:hypothetical protein